MFREMRRFKQALSNDECIEILNRNTSGVLAVSGDDDYPYAVPLSYVYHDNSLYFHCAKVGHKIDGILRNNKVSFCIVDQDEVIDKEYTTYFRSVICFGKAKLLEDSHDKIKALQYLAEYLCPTNVFQSEEFEKTLDSVGIIKLEIEQLTGKEAKELMLAKQKKV